MSAHSPICVDIVDCFRVSFGVGTPVFKYVSHFAQQQGRSKRLFDVRETRLQHPVPHDGVIGIPGHEKHAQRRSSRLQLSRELASAHPRHDDIGQQQIDMRAMLLAIHQRERGGSVGRFEDGVAVALEQLPRDGANRGFVLDQQNRLAAA